MQNLVRLYVSPDNADKSLVDKTEFRKQKTALAAERDHYKKLLDDNERNMDTSLERTIEAFDLATYALERLKSPDLIMKRMILVKVGQNWVMEDQILECVAKFPFMKIKEGVAATARLPK